MNILFIHQNFPAQYRHLAPALAARGHRVLALAAQEREKIAGVETFVYGLVRAVPENLPAHLANLEAKFIRGASAARAAQALKDQGFCPDIICAHPGWGEALFLKDFFPETPLLLFHEFFYHARGFDVGFDLEFSGGQNPDAAQLAGISADLRVKNHHLLASIEAADALVTPTRFQASTLPTWALEKTHLIHDGINTDDLTPEGAGVNLVFDGVTLSEDAPIVTFVNRNLEPYRGYHMFMRSLPKLLADNPAAHVVIVGGDEVSYGAHPPAGQTWKQIFFDEVAAQIDVSRVHFVGKLPYAHFVALLRRSWVHVYWTIPFVLSWSLLEAMSLARAIVASDTAPVREVLRHGENALLCDYFSPKDLANQVTRLLADRALAAQLGAQARLDVVRDYDLTRVCLPKQIALVENLAQQN